MPFGLAHRMGPELVDTVGSKKTASRAHKAQWFGNFIILPIIANYSETNNLELLSSFIVGTTTSLPK